MTWKKLKEAMDILNPYTGNGDSDAYNELWHSVNVLYNLGLIDRTLADKMYNYDEKLSE